jgi:glucose/arabinose dehydrogenase
MLSLLALLLGFATHAADLPLATLKVPPHFKVEVLARVPNARAMSLSPAGTIFVGSRSEGKVYAVVRKNLRTQEVVTLARGQHSPAGVAYRDGDLYFSAVDKIWRLPQVEKNLKKPPAPVLVSDQFPKDEHHGWKFIAFSPDGKLYVPIGAPCNVCDRGTKYANIMRMNKDGSNLELFAQGIRNTVGFDWHPQTHELWFTDNGRDLMGDDVPPCELNHAPRAGMNFGFPFCHGNGIPDPEFKP